MRDPLNSKECSKYLKAVSEPDRLRIVQCLRAGPKSVGLIADHLRAPFGNVSHHLRLLRQAGLVESSRNGRSIVYSLAPRFARSRRGGSLDVLEFGCCRVELTQR